MKNVDFQKLMIESTGSETSVLDGLREELSSLRREESSYNDKINERKLAGKRVGIHLNDGLTEVQDRIEEIEKEIISAQTVREIPKFDFDMDEVLDPMNIELRAKVRKQLRLVLKAVKYWMFDKRIFIQLEYFNDVLSHMLVIDNKRGGGEVMYEMSIEEKR